MNLNGPCRADVFLKVWPRLIGKCSPKQSPAMHFQSRQDHTLSE